MIRLRPPNRWYQSGFLAPTETNLGERAVDANDKEFAAQVASAGGALVKRRGTGPFALRLEQVQPALRAHQREWQQRYQLQRIGLFGCRGAGLPGFTPAMREPRPPQP